MWDDERITPLHPQDFVMRLDTNTIAELLGREMFHAADHEKSGIDMSAGAIRNHLRDTRPEAFDTDVYDAAFQRGATGNAFMPDPDAPSVRRRPDLPPKTHGPLVPAPMYDKALMALTRRLRATLKRREHRRNVAFLKAQAAATAATKTSA